MNLTQFGILLLIVFYTKNALAYYSDDLEDLDNEEQQIAKFAYEVASIAQSKMDEYNEDIDYQVTQSEFAPQLLIVEPNGISRMNLSNSVRWMVERTEKIGDVDYHFAQNRMYWSDMSTGRIYWRPLNSKSQVAFNKEIFVELSPLTWRPRSLAVDHITDKLYVLDTIGNTVHVFDLNDNKICFTFKKFLFNPLDIALDPSEGYMFIADHTKLVRVSMDGKSPEALVEQSLYSVTSITLDLDKKRVYWSEVSFHRIKSSNYDGSDQRIVLKNDSNKAYQLIGTSSLAFYESQLFFYEKVRQNIASINIEGPEEKAIESSYKVIYDWLIVRSIRLVHPSMQKPFVNPCANEHCSTQQMCFISAKDSSKGLESTCIDLN